MAFDLAGRVVLQDAFSGTLDKLINQTRAAGTELGKLDDATVAPVKNATAQIQRLEQELARLRTAARTGTLTLGDTSNLSATSAAIRTVNTDMTTVGATGSRLTGTMRGLAGAAAAVGVSFGALQLGRMLLNFTNVGANADALGEALDGLSARAGVDGRAIVREIQDAADGTISSIDAMRIVNRQFLSDNKELASQLPQLFKVADAAAKALGTDVAPAFESLIEAISGGQTRQLRTIGLYIDSEAALAAYADTIGKSVGNLTLADRQMALFNATMQAGIPLIDATGSAMADASDKMASMPVAIGEAKQAIGELLVAMGTADAIGEFAQGINRATTQLNQLSQFGDLSEALVKAGDVELAGQFRKEMTGINRELALTPPWKDPVAAAAEATAKRAALLDQMREEIALNRTINGEPWNGIPVQAIASTQEATVSVEAFNTALQGTRDKLQGIEGVAGGLGDLTANVQNLALDVPEMPKLGENLLTFDAGPVRDYIAAISALNPELTQAAEGQKSVADQALASVAAMEAHQNATINAALAIGDQNAGLQMLIGLFGGAGAGALDLVGSFDTLTPAAQNAALSLGLMTAAVSELRAQANAPISLNVAVGGLERGLSQIDALALRLARVSDPETARAFRDRAQSDLTGHWQSMGEIDEFGLDLLIQGELSGYEELVSNQTAAHTASEKALRTHGQTLQRDAGAIRSQIEGALRQGLEVTPGDIMAAQAGTYQDKALEAARQLQAIAERGFAEIQAHPDWAALLKIPPDVLAGSEAGLKAWAAQTQEQVQNLARPDLINWDAFVANFQQGMENTAAQELTIDIALGKLDEAGLLEGQSKEDARKAVLEQLGLAEPEITFASMFQTPTDQTPSTLASDWLGASGLEAVPLPTTLLPPETPLGLAAAESVAIPATLDAQQTAETARAEGVTAPLTATPTIDPAAFEQSGKDIAGALFTSFEAAVKAQDVGALVASHWAADFAANVVQFQGIGTSMGKEMSGAFVLAIKAGVGEVRRDMATILAPEVASILQAGRGGPLP